MLAVAPAGRAMAGFAPTLDSQSAQAADYAKIRQALENKKVSSALADLGYSPGEIEHRLASLSEAEVHALAGQLDAAMVPAGDGTAFLIIGIVLAVVIFTVVLIAAAHPG
jgi:hypothetical protein